ncbi:MAG: hypothetical protein ACOH2Q_22045 [Rhodococcus sp. (in: high G+C Gram-positive bacteria)]
MSDNESSLSVASALLSRLGRLWQLADPPPPSLADDLVVFLAMSGVESEWEELQLVSSDELAGVRAASSTQTLEFELGDIALLVRVAPESTRSGRIDGWLTIENDEIPAGTFVTLVTGDSDRTTQVDQDGRFEFSDVRDSPWRLRFSFSDNTRLVQTPPRQW